MVEANVASCCYPQIYMDYFCNCESYHLLNIHPDTVKMFHLNCEVMQGDDDWEEVDNYGEVNTGL